MMKIVVELELKIVVDTHKTEVYLQKRPCFDYLLSVIFIFYGNKCNYLLVGVGMYQSKYISRCYITENT